MKTSPDPMLSLSAPQVIKPLLFIYKYQAAKRHQESVPRQYIPPLQMYHHHVPFHCMSLMYFRGF